MWRIKDYVNIVFPSELKERVDFLEVPGKHNNGLSALIYHFSLLNALKGKEGAKEIHDFLIDEHPFYRENWYFNPVFARKTEMLSTIIKWSMK
jgi:hypothetical protein